MTNLIQLPGLISENYSVPALGFYIRVGYNDQKQLLESIAQGERAFNGLVIDASNVIRHQDLCIEARKKRFDLILDPKILAMSMDGGYKVKMEDLPWGLKRPFNREDFTNSNGKIIAERLVTFAMENNFTQILGPTHLLQNPKDPWLNIDIEMMNYVSEIIKNNNFNLHLIYPLSLPMQIFRDPVHFHSIVNDLTKANFDSIWLRIDMFGSDASGEKTIGYIEACQQLHELKKTIIADYVGGLPGLGLLAFGAVGGISHGITLYESFNSYSLKKKSQNNGGFMPPTRVYFPHLDVQLNKKDASMFLDISNRIKLKYGCRDHHCCPGGVQDMLNHPVHHYIHQRSAQIENLSNIPDSIKVKVFLEKNVRGVSDNLSTTISSSSISNEIWNKLAKKINVISHFRDTLYHYADKQLIDKSKVILPTRIINREERNIHN